MHRPEKYPPSLGQDTVFQSIPDPAFRLDRQGIILDINPAAAPGIGAAGQRIQDGLPRHICIQLTEALEQVAASRTTVTLEWAEATGGRETHQEMRLAPLPDGEVLALVRDITERKLTENALRESDARFKVLANNLTDALWIRSPDMRELRYLSPAFERIWGRPVQELHAEPHKWMDFIVPEDREQVVRTFAGITADSPSLDVEYRIMRPDGERRWVRVRGFQVRDARGKLVCNTGIVTDTTERKLAQAQLNAAHKQVMEAARRAGMEEIATNVLHNVGNILNSVTVSASLLRGRLGTSRSQGLHRAVQMLQEHQGDLGDFLTRDDKGRLLPGYLGGIAQALLQEQQDMAAELDHLTRGIDHIRDVVAAQQSYSGRAGTVEPALIGDLVEDALRINAEALRRSRVEVARRFDAEPRVRVDRSRVLQILVNLIGNAREALESAPPQSRRITVRVRAKEGRLQVAVQDGGEGIPPDNLSRIFAHGFTTRKHGHGFGLHSCAQAAAEMQGSLTVHSDGPGQGATFTLDLPLDIAEPCA